MTTQTNKTPRAIALLLQDAYWYADCAADEKSDGRGMAPTRGEALRRSFQNARAAGLKLSTILFPRVISTARALQDAVERYGVEQGVDARTGEVMAKAVLGARVEDIACGRVGTITNIDGPSHVTLDVGGKQYQARGKDLREVKPATEATEQKKLMVAMVADVEAGIRVLNTSGRYTISETDITERARNIVAGLIGNYVIKAALPTTTAGQTGPIGPGPCPTGHPGAMGPPGEPR